MSAVEQGHGHVFKRPDGSFAKCFGPPHCMECQRDADAKERALAMPLASRLALAAAIAGIVGAALFLLLAPLGAVLAVLAAMIGGR